MRNKSLGKSTVCQLGDVIASLVGPLPRWVSWGFFIALGLVGNDKRASLNKQPRTARAKAVGMGGQVGFSVPGARGAIPTTSLAISAKGG